MDRLKQVVNRYFAPYKPQLLCQAFADAEYYRRDGYRLSVLDPVLRITYRQPQAAGRPYSVIGDFLFSQQAHDIQRPLVGHFDAYIFLFCKLLQDRLQLRVFRSGNDAQHRAAIA